MLNGNFLIIRRVWGHLSRGSLERDIRSYFVGRIFIAIVLFWSVPLLTRGLGIESYGRLSLLLLIANWIPPVIGGWLQQGILRYHKTYSAKFADYWKTLDRVQLLLVPLGVGLAITASSLIARATVLERCLLGGVAAFRLLRMSYASVAQAELRPSLVVWSELARSALPVCILGATMIVGSFTVAFVVGCFLFGALCASVVPYFCLDQIRINGGRFNGLIVGKMFRYGLPLTMWFGLSMGQIVLGRFILERYELREALGMYSAYQDFITKGATFLFMPITYALHGQAMASWAKGEYGASKVAIRRASAYQFAIAAGLMCVVIIGYPWINAILWGQTHYGIDASGRVLLILISLALCVGNLGLVAHKGLELAEQTRRMAVVMGVCLTMNLFVAMYLVESHGAIGIAIGLCCGNGCYFVTSQMLSMRFLRNY